MGYCRPEVPKAPVPKVEKVQRSNPRFIILCYFVHKIQPKKWRAEAGLLPASFAPGGGPAVRKTRGPVRPEDLNRISGKRLKYPHVP